MRKDPPGTADRLTADFMRVMRTTLIESLREAEREEVCLRDLERVTRQAMQQLGQRYLELLMETCQPAEPPRERQCRCGARTEYVQKRTGTVTTWLGQVVAEQAYHLCPTCGHGTYPLDEQLGFRAGGLSASLQEGRPWWACMSPLWKVASFLRD